MVKFRTHYENLQVAENASIEVIKGAYRYLSQKWHPDKNPGNREVAERNTIIINEAYRVLSDTELRRLHDIWITERRAQNENDILASTTRTDDTSTDAESGHQEHNLLPTIWNPSAAANWSILFTPIFGAWLHAKNWVALGEAERARRSMRWVYFYATFIAASLFLPEGISPAIAFWVLVIWYFLSGRPQAKYVKSRFKDYSKKGWAKPLGFAVLVLFVYIGVLGIFFPEFE